MYTFRVCHLCTFLWPPFLFRGHPYIRRTTVCHDDIRWMKKVSVTNYSLENNSLTFRLNAPVVIRAKVKEVRTNITISSHTLLRIHVVGGQRLVRIDPPSLPPHPAARDVRSLTQVRVRAWHNNFMSSSYHLQWISFSTMWCHHESYYTLLLYNCPWCHRLMGYGIMVRAWSCSLLGICPDS